MDEKIIFPGSDEAFFREHPYRRFHIRKPLYDKEFDVQFWSLGDHAHDRRRVIAVRVNPRGAFLKGHPIMQIPFLAFIDEEIADTDEMLKPIVDEMMADAAKGYGMKVPPRRK